MASNLIPANIRTAAKTHQGGKLAVARTKGQFVGYTFESAGLFNAITPEGKVVTLSYLNRGAATMYLAKEAREGQVTIVLAGRVAKALGVQGTESPAQGKGVQVTIVTTKASALELRAKLAEVNISASAKARHLGRIDAALAAA